MTDRQSDFERFDEVVRKVFAVPHNEIVKREKQWKRKRKQIRDKRARTSLASRALGDKD